MSCSQACALGPAFLEVPSKTFCEPAFSPRLDLPVLEGRVWTHLRHYSIPGPPNILGRKRERGQRRGGEREKKGEEGRKRDRVGGSREEGTKGPREEGRRGLLVLNPAASCFRSHPPQIQVV